MAVPQLADLYWTGGLFRVALRCPDNTPQHLSTKALAVLQEFRTDCQEQYCAFTAPVNGRDLAYKKLKPLVESRNSMYSVGTAFPNSEQRPGRSTIAQMAQGDLLDALAPGGAFGDLCAKALVVMMYLRWDEYFRPRIADILSVNKNAVKSDLMGDIRHLRISIIHKNSVLPSNFNDKLTYLPHIWRLNREQLTITEPMVHSLMEQINAIRVRVDPGT